ncbi:MULTISPECIES: hypothetical protein [Cyanophyceae]|nr:MULTISPECIES: hypothetical protein [Cyanophyceae]
MGDRLDERNLLLWGRSPLTDTVEVPGSSASQPLDNPIAKAG